MATTDQEQRGAFVPQHKRLAQGEDVVAYPKINGGSGKAPAPKSGLDSVAKKK